MLGLDGYAGGWVAVSWRPSAPPRLSHGNQLDDLILRIEDAWGRSMACIAIDMPIGLPERGVRASDAAVRTLLGPRRSSLFATPVRDAVYARDWAEASAAQRALAGVGLSKQSFALRGGIIQVADWMERTGRIAYEVHPELSFAVLAGERGGERGGASMAGEPLIAPLGAAKTTWNGQHARAALLRDVGLLPDPDLGDIGARVPPADVLDAAIVAWSAARIAAGRACRFPPAIVSGPPSRPDPMAVWA